MVASRVRAFADGGAARRATTRVADHADRSLSPGDRVELRRQASTNTSVTRAAPGRPQRCGAALRDQRGLGEDRRRRRSVAADDARDLVVDLDVRRGLADQRRRRRDPEQVGRLASSTTTSTRATPARGPRLRRPGPSLPTTTTTPGRAEVGELDGASHDRVADDGRLRPADRRLRRRHRATPAPLPASSARPAASTSAARTTTIPRAGVRSSGVYQWMGTRAEPRPRHRGLHRLRALEATSTRRRSSPTRCRTRC